MAGPAPWNRGFWAQRCDRPLAFAAVGSHGSYSLILPPCATEPQLKQFAKQFNEYLARQAKVGNR